MKYFLPILKALEGEDIRYVVVGGIATVLNGYPRLTGDIDLILDLADRTNCTEVLKRLQNLKMTPRNPVNIFDFADPDKRREWVEEKGMLVFSLYSPLFPLLEVDLFVKDPMPFSELFNNSRIMVVENTKIRVASLDDLIFLKKLAGRPKDLEDIDNLLLIKNYNR